MIASREAPLYLPQLEHDSCGVGLLADLRGRASHELVERGLGALARLAHRGGGAGPVRLPDGAGILTEIPWALFASDLPRRAIAPDQSRAAGMLYFPPGAVLPLQAEATRALEACQWKLVCWRRVPIDASAVTPALSAGAPEIWQAFALNRGPAHDAEKRLYRARLCLEMAFRGIRVARGFGDAAVVSLSTRTIVYKGLLEPHRLATFYLDLRHPRFETRLMIVHERFSTNTCPRWDLAQPFRVLAHNGEINTIAGNRLWMAARQRDVRALPGFDPAGVGEAVRTTGSDSQSLDDAVELLRHGGCSLPHALARLIPPAWEHDPRLSPGERAFFQFQACLSEPWDGPAAVAFADGRVAGALLDRNGLRPARFVRTAEEQFFLGSEAGIFDVPDASVRRRGRLGPGEMLTIDVERGNVRYPPQVRRGLAARRPYGGWTSRAIVSLPEHAPAVASDTRASSQGLAAAADARDMNATDRLRRRQTLFGYTSEELTVILGPMAEDGKEAVGSMGDDTPLAVLSPRPRLFPDFFRQRFAQVTNPPIDSLRERAVMSLQTVLGARTNALDEDSPDHRWLTLPSPVVTDAQFTGLCVAPGFPAAVISMLFDRSGGEAGLAERLDAMVEAARSAVDAGAVLLILSDSGADEARAPLPPLLGTAAVHHGLIAAGRRMRASLIVETGEARDPHQVAALLAFGASVVFPSLAYDTVAAMAAERGTDRDEAVARYRKALDDGLLKIFSKMGIATASGYVGAQLFEILGLDRRLADRYFPGAPCHLGGAGSGDPLAGVVRHVLERHAAAFAPGTLQLAHPGLHGYRRDGEYHANNPALVRELHRAARSKSDQAYEHFTHMVYDRPPTAVRDLVQFRAALQATGPIPLDEVEPAETICRRFFGSAMSVGALSPEAHRTVAIAMNMLSARSNSGEGGEEAERWRPRPGEPSANSATKQVASARFGVTPGYLVSATELQIKIAQGSKPGEGGQLPAIKAVPHIARLRHAQPGITLISPPPHHDIYSIEDLAQLIHDLREVNPRARINVKLVAQAGVGIVAAGVAKAGADAILISGHDGGTGASPRGSIKHAGSPWELGLAETQQVLALNGLRDRVALQTDGGLKTGRDVAIAAALGADEFGFGTAALVAVGCVMARQCHLNTCPAGIATQREDLRRRFAGTPEMVVSYFRLLAEEVRRILAQLGLRGVHELVGRVDLLEPKPGAAPLDLRPLLTPGDGVTPRFNESKWGLTPNLNASIVEEAGPALGLHPVRLSYRIQNTDRSVGARLAGAIARCYGDAGAPQPVHLAFTGSAGQSFGAFLLPGMYVELTGESNDYLAKGMHGGQTVIRPPQHAGLPRAQSRGARREDVDVLCGNTALYGATGGRVFIAGAAGERFAVRNSGAVAVVEGVGDHGCEYMTGGVVVVLGPIGCNFAAGMTGGLAYVWDPNGQFHRRCNQEMVGIHSPDQDDLTELRRLIIAHGDLTGSRRAADLLEHWRDSSRAFRKVIPIPVSVPARTTAPAVMDDAPQKRGQSPFFTL